MTPDEQPTGRKVDSLNDYVDALLTGQRPSTRADDAKTAEAFRMAAFLASAESHRAQPSAAFVASLRERLQGRRSSRLQLRFTRRVFLRGFAGGIATLAVCLFGEQSLQRLFGERKAPAGWVPIARASELPPGTVKRFVAGDKDGHVMNIGGRIWALSAVCTHQACLLNWNGEREEFLCECHGAQFDTSGQQMGIDEYKVPLRPLAKIPVQQLDGTIYVVTA